MGFGLTLSARKEITKKEALEYAKASKKDKGVILDRVQAEIGWSRANARRQLTNALKRRGPASAVKRKPRSRTYGYDTVKILQRVWAMSGQPCGKYLAPVMETTLDNFEQHTMSKPFGPDRARYTPYVREQLLKMSPATIDRLLGPFKTELYPDAKTSTKSVGNKYREAIPIMTRIPQIDKQPGLVAIDTVAHCGHTLKGEYAYTLTVTDAFTGWTVNRAIKNKAAKWIVEAMDDIASQFPYPIDHCHSDNGSEFLNDAVTRWCQEHQIRMTRSRAHKSNDNPFAEQKNGDIVRRSAFHYRYDTPKELTILHELWPLVNLRKNLFLPTKKATGYRVTKTGRHVRLYDSPRTPANRVKDTGIMLPPERQALEELLKGLDLAAITRRISELQGELMHLATTKTYSQAHVA